MQPIEVSWIVLFLIFGAIGLVRGFLKELGVTTTTVVSIYVIAEVLERRGVMDRLLGRAEAIPALATLTTEDPRRSLVKFIVYLLFMVFMVFISYHGETLKFGGSPPKGLAGALLSLMVGLLNGYLIVGTLWYYLDRFDYPTQLLGLYQGELSPLASTLRSLLLFNLLPENLWEPVLLFFIILLIIARIIR